MRRPSVLILDFGSQYTQLIARAIRDLGVYCEIESYSVGAKHLAARMPKALVLSGGPASVRDRGAPKAVQAILDAKLPTLAICYGMQWLSHTHRGKVEQGTSREYGAAQIVVEKAEGLFAGFTVGEKCDVWMSHGDSVTELPPGATRTARSEGCPVAALQFGHFHGVQFHPEVAHTKIGRRLLENFLFRIARLEKDWAVGDFIEEQTRLIRERVGDAEVIGAVSGGVDSTVLAVFLGKALGKQFHPFLIDNGLLRKDEAAQVKEALQALGVPLTVVNAQSLFLKRLAGVADPEKKRKIIGRTFIEVFEKQLKKHKRAKFLAQGTLYPDVIESVSVKGPSQTIKTHHNVGGLPKRMKLELIEPFRELFKDEVRALGRQLGVPEALIERHPFPGPGLAVRVLGPVRPDRLRLVREADAIFTEEMRSAGLYPKIWQAFAALLPVRSVGVMGDSRTYESVVVLRAVTSRDGMTADWFGFDKEFLGRVSNRIINEVKGINRVAYDISSKPPATIEWE
jgi:GMP synthase (glutamine-hydrolysing)